MMKTYALIVSLLVCSVYGSQGPSLLNNLNEGVGIVKNTVTAYRNDTETLSVFDDNEELVTVDLVSAYSAPPMSFEKTQVNLEDQVFFYLYTRKNPKDFEQLKVDDAKNLKSKKFDASKPTKFITHGWVNSYMSKACTAIRDAFLQHGDYNVIVVDWSKISKTRYGFASSRVVMVGKFVAHMIDFLVSQGLEPSKVTVVGHSLGAHVAGLSGHYSNHTIQYIVGLDPALPFFTSAGPGSRISSDDARYVEIIHTNGGELGFLDELGDADFYPNGGSIQPGCVIAVGACSHLQAVEYFAESINSKTGFWAVSCAYIVDYVLNRCNKQPTALMGGVEPKFNVSGPYFLSTYFVDPYAMGAAISEKLERSFN